MKKMCGFMRRVAAIAAAAVIPAAAGAAEWFVAVDGSDSADGKTEATAFLTIQKAVTSAASGDTITLLPGDHVAGGKSVSSSQCRVAIEKANITLRSRDGRDATRIVGAWSTTESSFPWGIGAGAVRCVWVKSAGTGARLEGITFVNGSVPTTSGTAADNGNAGGGVMITSGASATIVDCAFVDCQGTNGGGLYYGNQDANVKVVRTLFKRCRSAKFGYAMRGGAVYNCVFDDNGRTRTKDGTIKTSDTTLRGAISYPKEVVNCTFVCNEGYGIGGDGNVDTVLNCLFADNGYDTSGGPFSSHVKTYNNCVTDKEGLTENSSVYSDFASSTEVFSPADGDYRLVKGAAALTAGNTDFLGSIPEEFRDKDYLGNPRTTDGAVYVGAVQGVADAEASGVELRWRKDGEWSVGGATLPVRNRTWKAAEGWPVPVLAQFVPASGSALVRYDLGGEVLWPRRDDAAWVAANAAGTVSLLAPVVTSNIVWADPVNGDDDTGDGTEANPYKTLGMAATNSLSSHVVYAKAGDYNEGGVKMLSLASRVAVPATFSGDMRIVAVDGPETTFITGEADPSDETVYGLGTDAVRCVAIVAKAGNNVALQGFTLRDGHTSTTTGDSGRGGALTNASGDTNLGTGWLVDCAVKDCAGQQGGVAFGGSLVRCRVSDSRCKAENNGIFRGAVVVSSLITGCDGGNETKTAVFAAYAYGYNCTIYDNNRSAIYQSDTETIVNGLCNCLAAARKSGGYDLYRAKAFSSDRIKNTLYAKGDETAVSALDKTVVKESPVDFMYEDSGVLRLSEDSAGYALASPSNMKSCMDVNGDPFAFGADGNYQAGCFAPRPASERKTYYVDAANGDDANGGATEATAFRTLAAAMAGAECGDTVIALPGTYDDGTMLQSLAQSGGTVAPTLPARVVVRSGVTLESRDGAEMTVIKGAASTADGAKSGCGADAVRCVFLCRNATLRGFTVTEGHTLCAGVTSVNEYGGAVAGYAGTAATDKEFSGLVEGCIIKGNVARVHNSQYGTYRNCRFTDNENAENKMGFAVSRARLEGCYFEGNGEPGRHSTIYDCEVVNCTIRANQAGHSSGNGVVCNEGDDYASVRSLKNSIVEAAKIKVATVSNCLLAKEIENLASNPVNTGNAMGDALLDEYGVPLAGSPAIDAGDNALASAAFAAGRDGAGVRRVLNSRIDIGAYEFDWGVPWGRALGGKRLKITDMPSDASLADGSLVFADGTVEMAWTSTGRGSPFRFTAEAKDAGTLTVAANGEVLAVLTAADGAKSFRFESALPSNALTFTCDGDGAALSGFANESGLSIIIR